MNLIQHYYYESRSLLSLECRRVIETTLDYLFWDSEQWGDIENHRLDFKTRIARVVGANIITQQFGDKLKHFWYLLGETVHKEWKNKNEDKANSVHLVYEIAQMIAQRYDIQDAKDMHKK